MTGHRRAPAPLVLSRSAVATGTAFLALLIVLFGHQVGNTPSRANTVPEATRIETVDGDPQPERGPKGPRGARGPKGDPGDCNCEAQDPSAEKPYEAPSRPSGDTGTLPAPSAPQAPVAPSAPAPPAAPSGPSASTPGYTGPGALIYTQPIPNVGAGAGK